MPYYRFLWTEVAQSKVEANGVTMGEFENILRHPLSTESSRSTGRPIAVGLGEEGRLIVCVYELEGDFDVLPITAYEIESA